ncbi:hypothetical protein RZS28_09060 [Methylocapsa polymorpha]|uniref:Tetratricopeptide repeat protein n=1 Tax=Methylocapsa polymorpha TaxID=3080828 RepID=A0ABZ0HXE0_9HYPH|nr:hypothetical protein RZS28_09060 [Methylocapsa sp. RX1]
MAGLVGLLGVGLADRDPAWAGNAQSFPGVPGDLPDGWRDLGRDALPIPPRGNFDFGLDGFRTRPESGSPRGGAERQNSLDGSARSPDRAKETAAARAAKSKAARAENLKKALAPHEPPIAQRRRILDDLFRRLQAAADPEEAQGVADAIERVWLQSRSDTAELLMQRALASIQGQHYPLALSLLDKVVALEPDWAEAWNQRATARFLADDSDGAMADIDQVMKLEPRHFGALAGMGLILQRAGLDERALQIFNKALEIYPLQPDLQKTVEKLKLEVEGRDI